MTKKKFTRRTSAGPDITETRKRREPADYSEFIRTVIFRKISENRQWIRDVCERYRGIGEVPNDVWHRLDELVIDISREAEKCGETGHHYRTEPVRRATYNISHRVREMERKDMIVWWADQWDDNDDEWNVYVCNQIWLDIAIWLSENAKAEKELKKKDDDN